jgi:formylglycine-generating enzyme required for sulfatase activity
MNFNKETWKANAQNKYKKFKELVTKAGTPVYASVASLALMPLVETAMQSGISSISIPLITLISNLGTNLIATEIEKWKDSSKQISETDIIQWIETTATHNSQLRDEIDEILLKLDAIPNLQKHLSSDDKQWFLDAFQKQLKEMGNYDKYTNIIFQGDMVQGDKVHLKQDAKTIVMGNVYQNSVIHAPEKKQTLITETEKETNTQEIAYLNHMLRESGHMSLAGIDKKAASDAEIRLNIGAVYTALLTRTPQKEHDIRAMKSGQDKLRPALELLNSCKKLVLLGDPGSGKTTFVNYVAWCLAGEYCCHPYANIKMLTAPMPNKKDKMDKEDQQYWDHDALLPVHVVLRDFAARQLNNFSDSGQLPNYEILWQYIAYTLKHNGLKEYIPCLKKELKNRGCLVLLDGLDEVPEAGKKRDHIKHIIESFCDTFPNCRILVTSRIYAYQKQQWRLSDFQDAILANFSKGQIQQFIDRWYAHIAELRGIKPDDAQGRAELLKRAILNNPRLFVLAERPLLLTLMASIHAWRGGSLPEKREELYADAVELLLDWWESPKIVRDDKGKVQVLQPSLAEWLKVDRDKVRNLLNQMAFDAHRAQNELTGTADIPEKILVNGLMALSNNPDVRPGRLIQYLSERAGLIVQRGNEIYSFPHRTFQEYLAACYLTGDDFPEYIVQLFQEEPNRWREVTLLAGAKAIRGSTALIWSLINELCDSPPDQQSLNLNQLWSAHIAAQALVETVDLKQISAKKQEKVNQIIQWLLCILKAKDLPPSERAMAGNNLAKLGDPRPEIMDIDHMMFCLVPGGKFWMGEGKSMHPNTCKTFWMGKYPVTNAQFHAFITACGYNNKKYWAEAIRHGRWENGKIKDWGPRRSIPRQYGSPFDLPNHPVVGITWYEAMAFTRWLTEKWQKEKLLPKKWIITLPSEAQWEKSARGGEQIPRQFICEPARHLIKSYKSIAKSKINVVNNPIPKRNYPWGNSHNEKFANTKESEISATSTVGCFSGGASPYGCEELSGNVWEWTRSIDKDYPYQSDDGREDLDKIASSTWIIWRGGAYYNVTNSALCASRYGYYPYYVNDYLGFRVVSSPFFTSAL